jgi:hypothetical protein
MSLFSISFLDQLPEGMRDIFDDFVTGLQIWSGKEHNTDGSHKDVTASSLTLQNAKVGTLINLPFDAARFTSSAGTWTVSSTQAVILRVSRVGQLAFFEFVCDGSTLATTAAANFFIALPELHALPQNGPTITTGVVHTTGRLQWNDRQHATTGFGTVGVQATAFSGKIPQTRVVMYQDGGNFPVSNDLVIEGGCWFPLEAGNTGRTYYGL